MKTLNNCFWFKDLDPDGFEEADNGEGYVESYGRDVQVCDDEPLKN